MNNGVLRCYSAKQRIVFTHPQVFRGQFLLVIKVYIYNGFNSFVRSVDNGNKKKRKYKNDKKKHQTNEQNKHTQKTPNIITTLPNLLAGSKRRHHVLFLLVLVVTVIYLKPELLH